VLAKNLKPKGRRFSGSVTFEPKVTAGVGAPLKCVKGMLLSMIVGGEIRVKPSHCKEVKVTLAQDGKVVKEFVMGEDDLGKEIERQDKIHREADEANAKRPRPMPPKEILAIRAKRKWGADDIDAYIDSHRDFTDGVLTEDETVKYNIMCDREKTGLEKMCAYERFLIEECHWRYPDKNGQAKNKRRLAKEWKEFCKKQYAGKAPKVKLRGGKGTVKIGKTRRFEVKGIKK